MNKTYKLAIVGATGLVGRTALKILEKKIYLILNINYFAQKNQLEVQYVSLVKITLQMN